MYIDSFRVRNVNTGKEYEFSNFPDALKNYFDRFDDESEVEMLAVMKIAETERPI
jgi:hypothetical protein